MAERKTDYTGDWFGDWEVIDRVTAREAWMEKGKRYWLVKRETATGAEQRIVEQTALKNLPKEDVVVARPLASNGSCLVVDEGWAAVLPVADELAYDEVDFHVGEAPELAPMTAPRHPGCVGGEMPGCVASTYEPRGDQAESAQIARRAMGLADSLLVQEAIASVALDNDPEIGTYTLDELGDPFEGLPTQCPHKNISYIEDWSADLPVDNTVTMLGGIGMAAEDTVSEAELDERVSPEKADKAALRKLMGEIHTAREQRIALDEQLVELGIQLDNLMDLADALLKAMLTR